MTFESSITRCPYCGGALIIKRIDGQKRFLCAKCGKILYMNPVPAVSAVVINEKKILLAKRKKLPKIGSWNLPGGFLEPYEQPEEGVLRELREETGLKGESPKLCCAVTQKSNRYGSVLVLGFIILKVKGKLTPGDDTSSVKFFELDHIPHIPFPSHRKIISKAIDIINTNSLI